MKFIDPDGKKVVAANFASQAMILSTLNKADRAYVVFDKGGQISTEMLMMMGKKWNGRKSILG